MRDAPTRRTIGAGLIGNVLEWFDFAVYGFFAVEIGRQFFPSQSPTAQLMATFGIFAIGYLMRPVGGVLIGHVCDHLGRRTALVASITAMAVPTFLIGLLPGYETIGILAPIGLTVLRMLQGLSLGGEFPTSMVFLAEHAPQGRRGMMSGLAFFGAVTGLLLGSATGAILAAILSPEALADWGWRVPFLLGLLIGLSGSLLRRHILDTVPVRDSSQPAIVETLRHHSRLVWAIAGVSTFYAIAFHTLFIYLVNAMQVDDGFSAAEALLINTLSMAVLLPSMLLGAWLSDRYGRKPVLLGSAGAAFILAWPLFILFEQADPLLVLAGQSLAAVVIGMFGAALPALIIEATPARVRCTAVALGFNLSIGIVGGLTPVTATYIVERSGNQLAPALLIMAGALIAFLALFRFKETYRMPLEGEVIARMNDDRSQPQAKNAVTKPVYAMMSGSS